MGQLEAIVAAKLAQRRAQETFRSLKTAEGLVDFTSNDYLGFARSEELKQRIAENEKKYAHLSVGSTGSRLLSGNSKFAEEVESQIAAFHNAESALLFNSGYDANVGLFSSLGRNVDYIVYDELIHASVHDGMRLSKAKCIPFKHNDIEHLDELLTSLDGAVIIATESVFSMEGDKAPLEKIVQFSSKHNADIIVDEAHAVGLFGQGRGLVSELGLEDKVYARLVTFGKALGSHGSAVLGNDDLKQFLVNHARSLIFSTFMSNHSLISIKSVYDILSDSGFKILNISSLIQFIDSIDKSDFGFEIIGGGTPIFGVVVPGNNAVRSVARTVQEDGFDVRPIVSPTVPKGLERIRVCLHEFNTKEELTGLLDSLRKATQNV